MFLFKKFSLIGGGVLELAHLPVALAAGVRYGPSGGRRLVYFIDDMNMPFKDKYDTQSAIELLRQMVDYHGW